jgi:hypothetical protein
MNTDFSKPMANYQNTAGRPGYSSIGAFEAGVCTFLDDRKLTPSTPNGIILAGELTFINQA